MSGVLELVKVIGVKVPPGPNVISIPQNPSGRPVIFVINNSKYAITSVDASVKGSLPTAAASSWACRIECP